jgi:hypothetical protein
MTNHAITALAIAVAISTGPWVDDAAGQSVARFGVRPRVDAAATTVRVLPTGNEWPENQARVHLEFSTPMTPGMASANLRLLDDEGMEVAGAFLTSGEELWDPAGRRLTMEFAGALQAGRSYVIVIDPGWLDARGKQLVAPVAKQFTAVTADRTLPNPDAWRIAAPAFGSQEPVRLAFPESLDYAVLLHAVSVVDADGVMVEGSIEVGNEEREWRFIPTRPWAASKYSLVVDPRLEDAAGNNLMRRFDARDAPTVPHCPVQIEFLPVLRT